MLTRRDAAVGVDAFLKEHGVELEYSPAVSPQRHRGHRAGEGREIHRPNGVGVSG